MEKIINIDGRDVKFKSTGATPLIYSRCFNKDFFNDLFKMNSLGDLVNGKSKKSNTGEIDFEIFYRIVYILARGGNPDIPPMEQWFESFSEFPIISTVSELNDLLLSSIQGKKK